MNAENCFWGYKTENCFWGYEIEFSWLVVEKFRGKLFLGSYWVLKMLTFHFLRLCKKTNIFHVCGKASWLKQIKKIYCIHLQTQVSTQLHALCGAQTVLNKLSFNQNFSSDSKWNLFECEEKLRIRTKFISTLMNCFTYTNPEWGRTRDFPRTIEQLKRKQCLQKFCLIVVLEANPWSFDCGKSFQ